MITLVENAAIKSKHVLRASAAAASAAASAAALPTEDRPTISRVSSDWSLNLEQHCAFTLIASSVLDVVLGRIKTRKMSGSDKGKLETARARVREICTTSSTTSLFAFITGAAGTGKSRVIEAARNFAARWGSASALAVTATSGAAASLIKGSTWHHLFGVHPNADPKKVSAEVRNRFSPIGVLVVDEIGMAGLTALNKMNDRLQIIKNDRTKLFGGVHFFGFGDFRQLPPVGDKPLYTNPNKPGPKKRKAAAQSAPTDAKEEGTVAAVAKKIKPNGEKQRHEQMAIELWQNKMNVGVELIQNQRAVGDVKFADAMGRLSENTPTADDIEMINKRLITASNQLPPGVSPIVIVKNNTQRAAVNDFMYKVHCDSIRTEVGDNHWKSKRALRIDATVTAAPKFESKTRATIKAVTEQIRDKFPSVYEPSHVIGRIRLMIGGPVMVLKNEGTEAGIANGTLSILRNIILHDESEVRFDTQENTHYVEARHVKGLLLEYSNAMWREENPFDLDGCFPLAPKKTPVQLSKSKNALKYTVTQLPCCPCFALTGHKVQGATLPNVLVADWWSVKNPNSTGWEYVALSRVRSQESVYIMKLLPTDLKKYTKRHDIAFEMNRLRNKLFLPTKNRLLASAYS